MKKDFPSFSILPILNLMKTVGLTMWIRLMPNIREGARAKLSASIFISQPVWLLWWFYKMMKLHGKNFRALFAKWATTIIRAKFCVKASDSIGWNPVKPSLTLNFIMLHIQMKPACHQEAWAQSLTQNSSQGSRMYQDTRFNSGLCNSQITFRAQSPCPLWPK